MNDDIKLEIEQKGREYYCNNFIDPIDYDKAKIVIIDTKYTNIYTAGATEFYEKGDKDGYNRALDDINALIEKHGCVGCSNDPNDEDGGLDRWFKLEKELLKLKETADETPTK